MITKQKRVQSAQNSVPKLSRKRNNRSDSETVERAKNRGRQKLKKVHMWTDRIECKVIEKRSENWFVKNDRWVAVCRGL